MGQDKHKGRVMKFIAYAVTGGVILGTIGIAVVAFLGYDEVSDALDFVTKSLLPLWATWLGTILAFYFSKENLDAAAKTNSELLDRLSRRDQHFASKSVCEVMIPVDKMFTLDTAKDGNKSIDKILKEEINGRKYNRFPIYENDLLSKVVHRSLMLEYLYKEEGNVDKKLIDLLSDTEMLKRLDNSIGYVSESATLLDAKIEMDKFSDRADIFITKDGTSSSEVIGWITNVEICRHGRV